MVDTNKRIFNRFEVRFPAKFKDSRTNFGQEVFLRDASASGANFISRNRVNFYDKVSIEVDLPDGGSPMVLSGRVVWNKPASTSLWEIGVQFDEINFMKMQRLFKFSLPPE